MSAAERRAAIAEAFYRYLEHKMAGLGDDEGPMRGLHWVDDQIAADQAVYRYKIDLEVHVVQLPDGEAGDWL